MRKSMKKKLFTNLILLSISILICIKIVQTLKIEPKPSSAEKSNAKKITTISTFPNKDKLYNYLSDTKNRLKVYNSANALNNGDSANTCVYFVSEVLRQNGFDIPHSICNTSEILSYFDNLDFKKNTDYKQLKPGDICFTTGPNANKKSAPTHTYIFMGWVSPNKYDFAYICDNQAKDYEGKIYHTRNISMEYKIKDKSKDPFNFFITK